MRDKISHIVVGACGLIKFVLRFLYDLTTNPAAFFIRRLRCSPFPVTCAIAPSLTARAIPTGSCDLRDGSVSYGRAIPTVSCNLHCARLPAVSVTCKESAHRYAQLPVTYHIHGRFGRAVTARSKAFRFHGSKTYDEIFCKLCPDFSWHNIFFYEAVPGGG